LSDIVIDTHALIWYLLGSPELGAAARAAIESVERGDIRAFVPTVVLAEFCYAIQKHHLRIDYSQTISRLRSIPQLEIVPLELEDVAALGDPQFTAIPEMHDRLIVIAAYRRKASLVTRDRAMHHTHLASVIW
jgi:predicted nucleic acid-binding protein